MYVLITGGFGYLGGRLAQFLSARDDMQIVLGSRRNASAPDWLPQARVVTTEWNSVVGLERACEGMSAVVHLAGMNAPDSAADPAGALAFNGGASQRLVHAARKQRVERFIYFSTAHVYGSPLAGIITEQTTPTSSHPYATSHLVGERAVLDRESGDSMNAMIVRLSNAYGPPVHRDANCWMLLVNELCREAATSGRMTLRTSGMQRRDFVPIHDVCRAVFHLLSCPVDRLGNLIFNVGGNWSPTILEMATLIRERCTVILGRHPTLIRPQPVCTNANTTLDYCVDALRRTGFVNTTPRASEIDALLSFCAEAFA